ncbi:MAG: acetyl-CoA carboxylase carboxyltransferase subunit alpha [Lachnospiraceae bacterium]|nr:acetyl-CoA carboxylase carboxyltransferase subunit alpha [Lachnospiraceae bacterium]MDD7626796.1 acetyl-CoA carboxylase carboxyltransferase subunit alpha [Lachnospiraceae bacterium]MDY4118514.1 acetyl-CoA carboxylase carboxyltransferase subunit alpha [Lachnospiraceae bacterium]
MAILFHKKKEQDTTDVKQMIVCPSCQKEISKEDAVLNHYICTACGSYFRVRTKNRIRMVCDRGSFIPWFEEMDICNPLDFPGYEEKLSDVKEKTGLHEAVTVGMGEIYGEKVCLGICDARFLMSSMGHVVGEKIALMVERATEEKLAVVIFCCSGGARMQEGIVSLMQMAKTSAALKKHAEAGLLYVTVLTDPTTGGVTASFAMLGDIILAEPGALIGFAGPRVIEQTIGQKLPKGFQRAEFLLEHGFVDEIVERDDLKKTLYQILKSHRVSGNNDSFAGFTSEVENAHPSEISKERQAKTRIKTPWQKVKEARSLERPSALTYIDLIFDDFMELHGDRCFADDKAIVGGIATLYGQPVTVIGVQKGNDVKECSYRNYGMTSPEGYRKALRLMKQAEKFHRPIICFINTSGAYPGMEAEERGQGEAIARNLFEMAGLKVPVLSIVIGEGGSGGALGLAVANEVWMLENSTYSILSPEGFASILWKDGKRAEEAAGVMGITAEDLYRLHVIEKIIPEFGGADADTAADIAGCMKEQMTEFLKKFEDMSPEEIAEQRYQRFRKF